MKHDDNLALVPAVGDDELLAKTLRTVAVLVSACVLFVGALSLMAVLVTSKVVAPSGAPEAQKSDAPTTNSKKPTSI